MSVPDHAITPADNAWMRSLGGRFVVFDGPDGSGKSTQFRRFADMVRVSGIEVVEVREPGGTAIGEKIRAILLDPANAEMTTRTEMLLYMASRAQLFEQRIAPSLAAGALVLADRFVSSTLAYQGTAGGMDEEEILAVGEVAMKRLSPLLDRMEQKGADFHARVRSGYAAQARRWPERYAVVDSSVGPDEVTAGLLAAVQAWMSAAARPPRGATLRA